MSKTVKPKKSNNNNNNQIHAIDEVREALLESFVSKPETIHHLLLVGPPGCGKTTTARRIITSFYGKNIPPGAALFLNASDERGLESIRAKIYPFIQCKPILPSLTAITPPRFIILDEAETLTESAQLALRPVFETSAREICLIFIVNCISGIHPSLRHRFFRLQFLPPSVKTLEKRIETIDRGRNTPKILDAFRWRGDLRHFLLQPKDSNILTQMLYQWLHSPYEAEPETRKSILETAEDIISIGYLLKILNLNNMKELLTITDPAVNRVTNTLELKSRLKEIIKTYRKKLEDVTPF
uniref:AAA+ ATPase domain-containing protein n=1 Tax=viral metagenome TaxID=1070528 RepID=A0A6C0IAI9_9ZZZZ